MSWGVIGLVIFCFLVLFVLNAINQNLVAINRRKEEEEEERNNWLKDDDN